MNLSFHDMMPFPLIFLLGIVILWTSTVSQSLPGCPDSCGDLKVPYPFGMSEGCYLTDKFLVTCNQSFHTPKAFLRGLDLPLSNITMDGELTVLQSIAQDCQNHSKSGAAKDHYPDTATVSLPPVTISDTDNKFTALGCDTTEVLQGYRGKERITRKCISLCDSMEDLIFYNSCSGFGCCQTPVPAGLRNITVSVSSFSSYNYSESYYWASHNTANCRYAFVMEESKFKFSTSFREILNGKEKVPVVINWAIGEESCDEAKKRSNFSCKGKSSCVDASNLSGYLCRCLRGYQGNPYVEDGCQDIDECEMYNRCKNGKCLNLTGSWTCICPRGYVRTETGCSKLFVYHHHHSGSRRFLRYMAPAGILLGLSILLMGTCYTGIYWAVKKRNFLKSKEKFFVQNDGLILQKRLSDLSLRHRHLETGKIFTAEDLKRATNNYDKNGVIGEGGYGKVYKGILPDGQKVAIKKSKIGDQSQIEQFINEVTIVLQIDHMNVVKLVGCCLETEVPLLVYEFTANGTLFHHIHEKEKASVLPWKLRLRIASETAGALAYLHSATYMSIIHRDVKTSSIILDENYTAKVSDFGTSMLLPTDQNQLTTFVQGTLGYLDPEYFLSNLLTEKSDIYSFGVVSAELLTSKKPVSFDRPEGERNLAMLFLSAVEEDCLHNVLDGNIVDEVNAEEVKKVANIAKMCLSVRGKERPTMNEVANELTWTNMGKRLFLSRENEYLLDLDSSSHTLWKVIRLYMLVSQFCRKVRKQ